MVLFGSLFDHLFFFISGELDKIDIGGIEDITHIILWDFGGQVIYYTTHPMYLSRRCVYFLVFNLDMGLKTVVKEEGGRRAEYRTVMGRYISNLTRLTAIGLIKFWESYLQIDR